MFKILATATALSLAAFSAGAVTVTQSATPTTSSANPTPASVSVGSTFIDNLAGSTANVRRSPWEGTAFDGNTYSSITGGEVTYSFGGETRTKLSVVWGSPDDYNDLDFFLGGDLVHSISGETILPGNGTNGENALVTIGSLTFDTVVFRSTSAAFEYANVATVVPLPAGGLLLIGAIGGLAALRRRKA